MVVCACGVVCVWCGVGVVNEDEEGEEKGSSVVWCWGGG